MTLHFERYGTGKPLLLVHGLGGSSRSWSPVAQRLAREREVIAIDLPSHGKSPRATGDDSFAGLADATEAFLVGHGLGNVDAVGSSLGARLALELARRGRLASVVALDPGGFWEGWERHFFATTIGASIRVVRGLQPVMPAIAASPLGRSLLFAQLSAHPTRLSPDLVLGEARSLARTPTFEALARDLAYGPTQAGSPSTRGRLVIGWGRQDRLCLPQQAYRAASRFPRAELVWFGQCGHFPMWDRPQATVDVILRATRDADLTDMGGSAAQRRPSHEEAGPFMSA